MFWFIVGIIFLILGIVAAILTIRWKPRPDEEQIIRGAYGAAQANAALNGSLSPQILCEDYFKAIQNLKTPPTVIYPCDGTGSTPNTSGIIVNAGK